MLSEIVGIVFRVRQHLTPIAGGAEAIVIPEAETDPHDVAHECRSAYERGKAHTLLVVAEGARANTEAMAAYFQVHRERLGFELRVTKLGHVQRGGTSGTSDRLLATRFLVRVQLSRLCNADLESWSAGRTAKSLQLAWTK